MESCLVPFGMQSWSVSLRSTRHGSCVVHWCGDAETWQRLQAHKVLVSRYQIVHVMKRDVLVPSGNSTWWWFCTIWRSCSYWFLHASGCCYSKATAFIGFLLIVILFTNRMLQTRLWVLEGTMMRVIRVVKLLKGIWGRWLLPSGMCGWLATAHSYWRGAVSNLTRLNPQTPTLTASCDENQFTGEINSVWIVGELSSLAWSCCFSFLVILVC